MQLRRDCMEHSLTVVDPIFTSLSTSLALPVVHAKVVLLTRDYVSMHTTPNDMPFVTEFTEE